MALFLSTFVNKLDKKGRVSVPASYRAALASQSFKGIIAFPSHKYPCLEAFGMDRLEKISRQMDTFDLFSEERDNFSTTIFSDATELPYDGEGRITLTSHLIQHINVTDAVCFAGQGATFQLWHPDAFQTYRDAARLRTRTSGVTLPLQHKPEGA